jgi:hypothetical protein
MPTPADLGTDSENSATSGSQTLRSALTGIRADRRSSFSCTAARKADNAVERVEAG